MPDVECFYAIKANPDEQFAKLMIDRGHKFDCASAEEIRKVLSLGCSPQNIIYANPVKEDTHLEFARKVGVTCMTMDSEEECEKIKQIFPEAQVVLRIAVEETDAPCPMSKKFGAP